MTAPIDALLTSLQYADSAFPSGSFAFSWGLEGLAIDGLVTDRRSLLSAVHDTLHQRWQGVDRVVLSRVRAWHRSVAAPGGVRAEKVGDGGGGAGGGDDDALRGLEAEVDAMTWSQAARTGSRRAGRALLGVHARLGHQGASRHLMRIADDPRRTHLCVAQALVWCELSLSDAEVEAISAWSCANSLCSAATRLNLVGHVGAQQVLRDARALIATLLTQPVSPDIALRGFAPLTEIAMMRHAQREHRLFMT